MTDDLFLAWLLQCKHIWGQTDKLGVAIAEKPDVTPALMAAKFIPQVEDTLRNHIRYAIN